MLEKFNSNVCKFATCSWSVEIFELAISEIQDIFDLYKNVDNLLDPIFSIKNLRSPINKRFFQEKCPILDPKQQISPTTRPLRARRHSHKTCLKK